MPDASTFKNAPGDSAGDCTVSTLACHGHRRRGAPQKIGQESEQDRHRRNVQKGTAKPRLQPRRPRKAKGHRRVVRNKPFAGGYTTRHYGRPSEGVHALQIEINRALYMNEDRITRLASMQEIQAQMTEVVFALNGTAQADLAAE